MASPKFRLEVSYNETTGDPVAAYVRVREGKVAQMYSAIQTSQSVGMQTLDQCLVEMVRRNQVSLVEARQRGVNKDLFGG